MQPAADTIPDPPPAAPAGPLRVLACAMSLAAGLVHAASIGGTADYPTLSLLIAAAAVFGVGWGVVVWARAGRAVLVAGVAANLLIVVGYAVSRSVGISFIDGLHGSQPVGTPDLLAAFFSLGVVLAAAGLLVGQTPGEIARFSGARAWTVALAVTALCVPALVEASSASAGSTSAAGAAGDETATTVPEITPRPVDLAPVDPAATVLPPTTTTTTVKAFDPSKPIDLSGTPGVTKAEQQRAENLLRSTLTDLPQWSNPDVALAAGYHSIGDSGTGHEHLINWSLIEDSTMLDPKHPEALVYNTTTGTRQLEAAMFILPTKYNLKNVPDLGGKLTQWHIHDNLCFTSGESPLVSGLTDSLGNCPAGLVKFTPAPMVHVWITPNACGPFAALEGVGAGQVADGQVRNCDHVHTGIGF